MLSNEFDVLLKIDPISQNHGSQRKYFAAMRTKQTYRQETGKDFLFSLLKASISYKTCLHSKPR